MSFRHVARKISVIASKIIPPPINQAFVISPFSSPGCTTANVAVALGSRVGVAVGSAGVVLAGCGVDVAVFAPGGIGVREAVLALVFSSIVSVEMIAVYAAMNRIIWVVAEVLFGLVGIIQKQELLPIPLEEAEDLDWGSNSGKIPDPSTLADDPDADVSEEQNHSAI